MWGFLGSIPFIGKYKRILGASVIVGGAVARAFGADDVGYELTNIGVTVLGVGVAHAQVKEPK